MKSDTEISLFQREWHSYQWVINNNVMGHKELLSEAREILEQTFVSHPVSMMDLGCGDSSLIPQLVSNLNLTHYTGIDLAENVLKIATENLATLNTPYSFHCSNLFTTTPRDMPRPNLVYSAYAIHHGQKEDKRQLLQTLFQLLQPEGCLLIIDTVRKPSQQRKAYMSEVSRYFSNAIDNHEVLTSMLDHVQNFDFPEHESTLMEFATNAGWKLLHQRQLTHLPGFSATLLFFQKPDSEY